MKMAKTVVKNVGKRLEDLEQTQMLIKLVCSSIAESYFDDAYTKAKVKVGQTKRDLNDQNQYSI